jgi:hypothetical protein
LPVITASKEVTTPAPRVKVAQLKIISFFMKKETASNKKNATKNAIGK